MASPPGRDLLVTSQGATPSDRTSFYALAARPLWLWPMTMPLSTALRITSCAVILAITLFKVFIVTNVTILASSSFPAALAENRQPTPWRPPLGGTSVADGGRWASARRLRAYRSTRGACIRTGSQGGEATTCAAGCFNSSLHTYSNARSCHARRKRPRGAHRKRLRQLLGWLWLTHMCSHTALFASLAGLARHTPLRSATGLRCAARVARGGTPKIPPASVWLHASSKLYPLTVMLARPFSMG